MTKEFARLLWRIHSSHDEWLAVWGRFPICSIGSGTDVLREIIMARSVSTQPTEVELQILRILWASGGATARDVHNGLAEVEEKDTTYSTTVKMLSVMLEKGLVRRDESV